MHASTHQRRSRQITLSQNRLRISVLAEPQNRENDEEIQAARISPKVAPLAPPPASPLFPSSPFLPTLTMGNMPGGAAGAPGAGGRPGDAAKKGGAEDPTVSTHAQGEERERRGAVGCLMHRVTAADAVCLDSGSRWDAALGNGSSLGSALLCCGGCRCLQKKKKEKWAPPKMVRVGKKRKKGSGPQAAYKLPAALPVSKCKLRLLRLERIKDFLLLEEEFLSNQAARKPREQQDEEDKSKVDEIRGSPMSVGSIEEVIDEQHAIISSPNGPEYYVRHTKTHNSRGEKGGRGTEMRDRPGSRETGPGSERGAARSHVAGLFVCLSGEHHVVCGQGSDRARQHGVASQQADVCGGPAG